MIRDEAQANPMIAGQFNVPKSEYDGDTSVSPPSVENSLFETSNNTDNNDVTYLLETIDNEDLLQCSEAEGLLNYTRSDDLVAFCADSNLSENIFLSTLEAGTTNQRQIPDRKVFPNLEEHDNGRLQFELNLDPNKVGKNYWYYSKILNKVFIGLDKPFYIDVMYLPEIHEELILRLMLVYVDDMGSPVSRCNNHLCKDKTLNENEKHSVIRCGNANVLYIGTADGKTCADRLALEVKLNGIQPTEENINGLCKQTIQLTFVCQNSCIGRKQTAVIFTLETRTEILGKRIVNIKVCSCPKRDKQKDEQNFCLKRKAVQEELLSSGKRPSKIIKIKEEPVNNTTTSLQDVQTVEFAPIQALPGVRINETGNIHIPFNLPDIGLARRLAQNAYDMVAGQQAIVRVNPAKYTKYLIDLKKYIDHL